MPALDRPPAGELQANPTHHSWQVVDLAHAKWAAGSAASVWDLLSAALARTLVVGPRTTRSGVVRELDLREMEELVNKGAVTGPAAAWVSVVLADQDVALLEAIRNPTTHSRLSRHFVRSGGSPGGRGDRTHLMIDGVSHHVGDIVLLARDTAARLADDFFDRISTGAI